MITQSLLLLAASALPQSAPQVPTSITRPVASLTEIYFSRLRRSSPSSPAIRRIRQKLDSLLHKKFRRGDFLAKRPRDLATAWQSALPVALTRIRGGVLKKFRDPRYSIRPPRESHKDPVPAVLILRTTRTKGAANHLASQWGEGPELEEVAFILPEPSAEFDQFAPPRLNDRRDAIAEGARLRRTHQSLIHARTQLRLDSRRLVLDCGVNTGGFGLRFAAAFPDLIAGVILREPQDPGANYRLNNLEGKPVLMLCENARDHGCAPLQERLRLAGARVTTVAPEAHNLLDRLVAWRRAAQRPLFPDRTVVAPNIVGRRNEWLQIVHTLAEDGRTAWARAQVNRAQNRIEIRTAGVQVLRIHLNDALVDLDNKPTLLVNGNPIRDLGVRRSLDAMLESVRSRNDNTAIYAATYTLRIASPSAAGAGVVQPIEPAGAGVEPTPQPTDAPPASPDEADAPLEDPRAPFAPVAPAEEPFEDRTIDAPQLQDSAAETQASPVGAGVFDRAASPPPTIPGPRDVNLSAYWPLAALLAVGALLATLIVRNRRQLTPRTR